MPDLPKAYHPKNFEQDVYRRWEASGYFNPENLPNAKKRKPFVMAMPPPNITGELHTGHALGFTISDALIRYHRMLGEGALWVPGTDHAAIATQVVIERALRERGIDRRTLGRTKFLAEVWKWKEQYGSRIVAQTKRVGASADWSRERFTMDDGLTFAVQTAFKKMYDDGLIYRGERIINWCPECQTAISDLEVDHLQTPGTLWHLAYPLTEGSGTITVATTRPETMLGDTAVAVHPKDERYAALIGKTVRLPIVGREIPIIADERVDPAFGTGAVKVTPAHDPLDFDLGQTHSLPAVHVIGFDGKMTKEAGHDFAGLSVDDARRRMVVQLKESGVLVHSEEYMRAVAYCSRSKTAVEPLISLQWFVKTKPLAALAMKAVRSKKITIVPERFTKTFFHWMENIRDWNISRQIWWGHRLPVWYKRDKQGKELVKVSITSPGAGWKQDEDTLDTWFSSGLWTFSTLGWPKKTSDVKRFHPTSIMVTGWDILFFWVARMIIFSEYLLHEPPFKTVYLHGLVLDKDGKKMSKSKGTGIDPLIVADTYGMDALRMSLIIGNAPGQDFRLYEEKIEGYRNFANKLWNVARFILAQHRPNGPTEAASMADRWILAKTQGVIQTVTKAMDRFDFSRAGEALYVFAWHDFADWYIEASKVGRNPGVLYEVLETTLKLLHPFMPFITEAIWSSLHPDQFLMIEAWPKANPKISFVKEQAAFTLMQQAVTALRNFRVHAGLPAEAIGEFIGAEDPKLLHALSRVQVRQVDSLPVAGQYKPILLGQTRFQFEAQYVDKYKTWVQKERTSLEGYLRGLEQRLANEQFVTHAPASVVEEERQKLAEAKQRLLEL